MRLVKEGSCREPEIRIFYEEGMAAFEVTMGHGRISTARLKTAVRKMK